MTFLQNTIFYIFLALLAALASKFAKSATMAPNFFIFYSLQVSKLPKFYADLESVEKEEKKRTPKNVN